ncbi:MAG: ribose-phosphate diphosphokinase [Bacilli bacterium]|nr:ribose-phosphate diphosphokinase [Bacilli bacterium]
MSTESNKLRLIALKSALELGQKIDRHLTSFYGNEEESFIVPVDEIWFNDGHEKNKLSKSVREKDVYILQDIGNYSLEYEMHGFINHASPNDLAQQLRDVIGACNSHPDKISIIMPLLYNGRQHRRNGREGLSCSRFLHELDMNQNVKRFLTFDAHDEGVQQAMFDTEFDNFYSTNDLLESFINNTDISELENVTFVAPDFGAMGRTQFYLNAFNSPHIKKDVGVFYKRRDYNIIENGKNPVIEHSYIGGDMTDRTAILIDDMISSGGSMLDSMKKLKERGAKHIYAMCTFALFTEGIDKFRESYNNGVFDGIYTTNLSYIPDEYKNEEWLNVVDCSYYLAKIIRNLHNDKSISGLLQDKGYTAKVLAKKFEGYR